MITFDEYEAECVRLEKWIKRLNFCEEEAVQYGRWDEAADWAVKKAMSYAALNNIAMEYYGQVELGPDDAWYDAHKEGHCM